MKSFSMFAVAVSFCAAVPVFAENSFIREVSLEVDAVETIDVAAGSETVIERISGARGTIVKTGGGTLRILMMHNSKVRFDVQGGKVFFDRQMPRVCADAFLHVDASRADTLELEEQNGTNFVVRWNDVRGNGMFATNCLAGPAWRTDPANRRAYISDVTQNGLPVVDFGPVMAKAHTNEQGEALGYGATMIWSETCTNAYEVYQVVSDTPETKDCGYYTSFMSSSLDRAGNYRGEKGSSQEGNIFHHNSNNNGWGHGRVYDDGELTASTTGGFRGRRGIGDGFSVLGFTTREYDEEMGFADYAARLDSFARDYDNVFGGLRIAEYIVFTNRLDSVDRTAVQNYLNAKWRGFVYAVSSLTVAPGASIGFAPGVKVKVANVSDMDDLTVEHGNCEINALLNPEAYFHVDADALDTLSLEEQNGTNFVNRWDDALSNGVYATASEKTFGDWLPDPWNRRPFVSKGELNNRDVVDFGPLQVHSHTNESGYGLGYGASMRWSEPMPSAARELFAIVRDTDDVKTLYGTGNVNVSEFGQAYICDPDSKRGYRGLLRENDWPYISYSNQFNYDLVDGKIYVDGLLSGWKSTTPGEGFHVMHFCLVDTKRPICPSYFAYSYTQTEKRHILGGTKIAEYLVFDHHLESAVRTNIYTALRTKWFNAPRKTRTFGNLTIGTGASISIPWNNISVTNCLTAGGDLTAASVSAAALHMTASGVEVSGSLEIEDGATVTVEALADGSFASLSAAELKLSGGGKVVLSASAGIKPRIGETKILCNYTGSFADWTVDVSDITNVSVCLKEKEDGIYAVVSPKGTVVLVR